MARGKSRLVLWLALGLVVMFGGFALVAYRLQPNANEGRYEAAVEYLQRRYAGPTVFVVAPLDDPRTRFRAIPGGYELIGVFRTDHPDYVGPGKSSLTGEFGFTMEVMESSHFGGLVRSHVVSDFNLGKVR